MFNILAVKTIGQSTKSVRAALEQIIQSDSTHNRAEAAPPTEREEDFRIKKRNNTSWGFCNVTKSYLKVT